MLYRSAESAAPPKCTSQMRHANAAPKCVSQKSYGCTGRMRQPNEPPKIGRFSKRFRPKLISGGVEVEIV
jgi:hypothetical protein